MLSCFVVRSPPTTASLTTHQEQNDEYGIWCGAELEPAEKGGTTRGEEPGLPFAWPQNSLSCVHLCHVTVSHSQEPPSHRHQQRYGQHRVSLAYRQSTELYTCVNIINKCGYNIYKTQPPCFLLNFALGETSEVDSKPAEDEPGSLSADANVDDVKAKTQDFTEDFTIFRKILRALFALIK